MSLAGNLGDGQGAADEENDGSEPLGGTPAGEQTSDFHIDELNKLGEILRYDGWGKVFKRWREHPAAAKHYSPSEYAVWGTGAEESHELPKLRGINWGMLNAAADKMAEIGSNRSAWAGHVDSLHRRLDESWKGKAADTAAERYQEMKPAINSYCDSAEGAARHVKSAMRVAKQQLGSGGLGGFKERSNFWKSYGPGSGEADDMLEDIDGMQKLVDEGVGRNPEQLREMGAFGRALLPRATSKAADKFDAVTVVPTWQELKLPGAPGCRQTTHIAVIGNDGTSTTERIKWLDTFCAWYAQDVKALRKRIHEAYELTEEAFSRLHTELSKLDANPFHKLTSAASGGDDSKSAGGEGNGGPNRSGSNPAGSGPATTGGGAAGGATSSSAGGGASMPSGDSAGGAAPTPPEMPKPDMTSPEEMTPDGAKSDAPEEAAAPQRELDQVTVGEGEQRITVREPDAQGRTQLTLTGEDGLPKTYEITFGSEQSAGPQASPGDAAGALGPRNVAGAEQPGEHSVPGSGSEGPPSAAGQPTMGGPPTPAWTQTGQQPDAIPVRVDEDGKAVIEEAGRTITVERTEDGQLRLSTEDGSGPTTTRTIDFGEESATSGPGNAATDRPTEAARAAQASVDSTQSDPRTQDSWQAQQQAAQPGGAMSSGADSSGVAQPTTTQTDSVPGPRAVPDEVANGFPAADPDGSVSPASSVDASIADDAPAATTLQWGSADADPRPFGAAASSGGGFRSFSGDLFGPSPGSDTEQQSGRGFTEPTGGTTFRAGATGLASMGESTSDSSAQGATGLGMMGDSGSGSGSGDQGGGARGGMMGMGGMGAMGGQQGGDQERTNDSPWRTEGQLFDDGTLDASSWLYQAVFGDNKEK